MEPLKQVNINIPREIAEWLADQESWRDTNKGRIAVASFMLFEEAAKVDRDAALLFASLLVRQRLEWESVKQYLAAPSDVRATIVKELRQMAFTPNGRARRGRLYVLQDEPPYVFPDSGAFDVVVTGKRPAESAAELDAKAQNTLKKRGAKQSKNQSA